MAGLIQKNMGPSSADEAIEKEPVEGVGPDGSPQHEGMEGESPEPSEVGDMADNDPAFVAAMKLAMQALYKNGGAEHVAQALQGAKDPAEGLANVAYDMTSIVDERTQGKVPDELFGLLAANILQEVADIAGAAGMPVSGPDIATAMKTMILRYLGEQGVDTTQLQQAMDQVDTNQFTEIPGKGQDQTQGQGA